MVQIRTGLLEMCLKISYLFTCFDVNVRVLTLTQILS